ncbi:MAG: N-acetyltransferase [Spirochaetaceae bacterium]|nr:MAG: N-acetyltransferase [Spirochaetaceae bacterium]
MCPLPVRGCCLPYPLHDSVGGMKIEHREEEARFVASLNGAEAELTYRQVAPGVLDYNHTWVPPELRGGGVGGALVRFALDHAREQGYAVRASCSFVARFLEH